MCEYVRKADQLGADMKKYKKNLGGGAISLISPTKCGLLGLACSSS